MKGETSGLANLLFLKFYIPAVRIIYLGGYHMKGISTILAMVLIVIIVVALIGMTYTFAVGLFSSTANVTQTQTDTVTKNMGKSVSIVAAKCYSGAGGNYTFTIRDTGTNAISGTELSAFADGVQLNVGFGAGLTAGQIAQFNSNNFNLAAGTHTLRVSAPAGEVDTQVTC
jgi:FlaG/FlaF family flagellin (archaellin)